MSKSTFMTHSTLPTYGANLQTGILDKLSFAVGNSDIPV